MTAITHPSLKDAERIALTNDRLGALKALRELKAEEPRPALGLEWSVAVMMAFDAGDDTLSRHFARQLAEEVPDDYRIWQLLGQAEIQVANGAGAVAAFQKALELAPNNPDVLLELGRAQGLHGELDAARTTLRRAVAISPMDHRALEHLAMIENFTDEPGLLDKLKTAQANAFLAEPDVRASLQYGLTQAYTKTGDVDQAWNSIKKGNKALASLQPGYKIDRYEWEVDRQIELFGKSLYPAKPKSRQGKGVVLVLGVPRSGTTLIERILAAHPKVKPAGENRIFWLAAQSVSGKSNEDVRDFVRDGDMNGMGQIYLDLMQERVGEFDFVTDKSLRNELRLGLIRAALPAAKVIWVRRNPLDTAWSCYRTRFAEGNPWSNTPQNTVRFIAGYEKLMRHWQGIYGKDMMQVDFDGFVMDPEPGIAQMLKFLELPKADLSQFHEQDGTVATASFAQVRQPVNQKGIGKWQPFDAYMQPFRDAIQEAGLAE
jgi:Flp pilus assembly protein TadD